MPKEIDGLKLYGLKEVSEKIGISMQSLRNYISDGKLKAKKFGKTYFVTEKTLKEYFEAA